jgi:hypothetical protein
MKYILLSSLASSEALEIVFLHKLSYVSIRFCSIELHLPSGSQMETKILCDVGTKIVVNSWHRCCIEMQLLMSPKFFLFFNKTFLAATESLLATVFLHE